MAEDKFPRLSSPHTDIEPVYDVVEVGSGYGASIAASRCSRAGQKVCVLERGKEWIPGEFPETLLDTRKHFQVTYEGKANAVGDPSDLYEAVVSKDITVIQGCGLGGGSLINANVGLDADPRVFEDPKWPQEIRDDMTSLMEIDRKHYHEMLLPSPYPDDYPELAKHRAMEKIAKGLRVVDIEDIGKVFQKTPLFVNFNEAKTAATRHRFDQPACNACGNCCSGCNTGAKNTLNMTYLPDAKAHGAQIFTMISVISVQRDPYSSTWMVFYKRNVDSKGLELKEQIVRAKHVILGAGALGSTKFLLKSKQRGLEISDKIGHSFTGNGDALGFSYHGNEVVNSVGLSTGKHAGEIQDDAPGPTITHVIDLRALKGMGVKEGMVIEAGTPPGASKAPLKVVMAFANKTLGVNGSLQLQMQHLIEKLNWNDIDKTLAFLCMAHDDSAGKISLDDKTDGVVIDWPDIGSQPVFESINKRLQQAANELGGAHVNPVWSDASDNQLLTVHPLGGCPMGEDGGSGVVNHKGQVFFDDTDVVHPGLYVMDGSILPTSVGVNPVGTISTIAERCMRLLIEDAGWNIDYDKHRDFIEALRTPRLLPGLRFTERMAGQLEMKQQDGAFSDCEFTVTIESQDVEKMIVHDPDHGADVTGTISCPALSKDPLSISNGKFSIFADSKEIVEAKEMTYHFVLTSSDCKKYFFQGKKIIKDDKFAEIGLTDTTTLFVTIQEESSFGSLLGRGILRISLRDFFHQLRSLEIINTDNLAEKLKWTAKFGKFFAKNIWDTYIGVSRKKVFYPNAPPRVKRPLRTNGALPVVHKVITEDNVELRLTRYNGGGKGPLIVAHGMGMDIRLYTLDTIETNFLEFYLEQGYDKDVQIVAHCASSVALWGSLLSGKLKGKVRSVVFSQAMALPEGSFMNTLKSKLHVSNILEKMGVKTVTANPYEDTFSRSLWLDYMSEVAAGAFTERSEHCNSVACHRITFLYGLIYKHANFNVATHDILHELFGTVAAGYFNHLSKIFRAKKILDKDGNDVYMPGVDNNGLKLNENEKIGWVSNVDLPTYMFIGSENDSFTPDGAKVMHDAMKSYHPNQDHEFHVIPGYGHVDNFMGKNACRDVWPDMLRFLDKYSDDNVAIRQMILKAIQKNVDALEHFQNNTGTLRDANVDEVANLNKQLGDVLHGAKMICWERKKISENIMHQAPKYNPPESNPDDIEQYHTVPVSLYDDTLKRDMYVISDLHLGGGWSKENLPKIKEFLFKLAKVAKTYVHTIVLFGDTLEMWMTPITMGPPTLKEMAKNWKSNEDIALIMRAIKKMAEEDDVKVYYVRGNHDFHMNEKTIHDLFGESVRFIPGKLIYLIHTETQEYSMRFEHGHDYDLLNCFDLAPANSPLQGNPIGYYIARCACSSNDTYLTNSEMVLQDAIKWMLSVLPKDSIGSTIAEVLSKDYFQKGFLRTLFEGALDQDPDDAVILCEDGKWVRISELMKYPFIKLAIKKYDSSKVFSMLEGSLGTFNDFLEEMAEDVVVLAHTHIFKNTKFTGKHGNMYYVNSGTWIDLTEHFSYVKIVPPKRDEDGIIQLEFSPNDSVKKVTKATK
eukprot:gene593-1255_t